MLKLIVYALGITAWLALSASPAQAEHIDGQAGDNMIAKAYCLTRGDAEKLSAAAAVDGDHGYIRVMNSPETRCFSVALHANVKPVAITLKRLVWTVRHKDGTEFQFWLAVDRTSRAIEGYVWFARKHSKRGHSI